MAARRSESLDELLDMIWELSAVSPEHCREAAVEAAFALVEDRGLDAADDVMALFARVQREETASAVDSRSEQHRAKSRRSLGPAMHPVFNRRDHPESFGRAAPGVHCHTSSAQGDAPAQTLRVEQVLVVGAGESGRPSRGHRDTDVATPLHDAAESESPEALSQGAAKTHKVRPHVDGSAFRDSGDVEQRGRLSGGAELPVAPERDSKRQRPEVSSEILDTYIKDVQVVSGVGKDFVDREVTKTAIIKDPRRQRKRR